MDLAPVDRKLLDTWQRDFPLASRPFLAVGEALDLSEEAVIGHLRRLLARGFISRLGGTCRPNTAGASTLAAMSVPVERVEAVAEAINAEPGVNHSYERENAWNLWFVATGPDRAHVEASLARIGRRTGLRVLDLPLVRPFNVDLGFGFDGATPAPAPKPLRPEVVEPGDAEILQGLCAGLEIVAEPYAALARRCGRTERQILARIGALLEAGVIGRLGIIVRHRALGWTSNAMVVWDVPQETIDHAGPLLAAMPGITLCYQRRTAGDDWPYSLYCMIHAQSRAEALERLRSAEAAAGLGGYPSRTLFSLRCFRQRGALVSLGEGVAA
jgi:siroheme decarboxylase